MTTRKASRRIREHKQYTQIDYEYLTAKGYTEDEVIKIWNRDAELGKKPLTAFDKAPDIVGYLNAKTNETGEDK